MTSSPATSALLNASSTGTSSAPISRRTVSTAAIWASGSAAEASTTCTRRSASATSSSVDRNASTSCVGSLRTKPTVSRQQDPLAAGKVEAAGGGVDGGEQAVLHQHPGVGEPVQQRGLAGVGVADDGDGLQPGPGPGLALDPTVLGVDLEVGLQLADPTQQPPAVDLELGLAAAEPGADAAGLLAEALALAPQPGQAVAEQGQLHLRLSLLAVGVLGEDVEDHRGAVDGGAAQDLLQVAALGRRQLLVEDDRVGVDLVRDLPQLLGLALAYERGCVGALPPLEDALDLVGAGGVDQGRQLVERRLGVVEGVGGHGHADEDDALPSAPLDERHQRTSPAATWRPTSPVR